MIWLLATDNDTDEPIAAGWPVESLLALLAQRHPHKTVKITTESGTLVAIRRRDGLVAYARPADPAWYGKVPAADQTPLPAVLRLPVA